MHIAHVAPEMAPFVKVGGLGDVVGSLPPAQARDGHRVTVVVPGYAKLLAAAGRTPGDGTPVEVGFPTATYAGVVHSFEHQGVRVLAIEQTELFGRPGIYGNPEGYPDNGLRFGWFVRAALEALGALAPVPDVVLAHDWPAALVPVFLASAPAGHPLKGTASVMVIHNLAHQGLFPLEFGGYLGLPDAQLGPGSLEGMGLMNWLKGGIVNATRVLTVSPTYAHEILTPAFGEGLDAALRSRGSALTGILNGLDTATWNPATDPHLPRAFDRDHLEGKWQVKAALQEELGFRVGDYPLFGIVTRVDAQKGVDLVAAITPWLLEAEGQIVLLGSGHRPLIKPLVDLAPYWTQSIALVERFDEPLAHRIYGGSDFFLMPSRFEPCGLSQMIALRYGTVPVVRRTGGLADTVRDVDERPEDGNGLVFEHADPGGLGWATGRALALFRDDRARLDRIRRTGMLDDFSWDGSARLYDAVLEEAVQRVRPATEA